MNIFNRNTPALKTNRPQDPFAVMNEMMKTMWNEGTNVEAFSPSVEVNETKNEYRVTAELPGMTKDNIDVQFEGNTLYLKGEKDMSRENTDDERLHYTERSYGSFTRVIPFGEEVDADKIEADFKNGVLALKLVKKPIDKKSQNSRITIR